MSVVGESGVYPKWPPHASSAGSVGVDGHVGGILVIPGALDGHVTEKDKRKTRGTSPSPSPSPEVHEHDQVAGPKPNANASFKSKCVNRSMDLKNDEKLEQEGAPSLNARRS